MTIALAMMSDASYQYQRREPKLAIIYKVIEEHAQNFFDMIANEPDSKTLPDFIKREFDKF